MLEKRRDDRQARLERTEKSWRFCVVDSGLASSNPAFMLRRRLLCSIPAVLTAGARMNASILTNRRLGLVIHSYSQRWMGRYSSVRVPPFKDVLDVFDHARSIGIGGLQVGQEGWSRELAQEVRSTCESYDMRLEGMIRLPQAAGDVERFTRELRLGQEAGATLFRTTLGGRRYEVFSRREDYEMWYSQALRSLEWAEPIARRLKVKIAVENHKDLETSELLRVMQKLASQHVGVCLDTGNSLALLEHPLEVVQSLAPYALTVHLKDLAVSLADQGFQMAEVPLGKGVLPLESMVNILRKESPQAAFYLEMITREPLLIPCLEETYWATFEQKSGRDLARILAWVRGHQKAALPAFNSLSQEAKLALEEKNITESLGFAAQILNFPQTQVMKAVREEER